MAKPSLSFKVSSDWVGTQNTGYSAMLAANGGVTPYTWSITAGNLPRGLSLNTITGAILGTPSGGGTSNFTVQVTDSNTPAGNASAPLSITVTAVVPLSITTTSLPSGTAGIAYSASVTAIGGVYPYTWSLTSGTLPDGLHLNASTGAITGTPTTVGTSNFTVQVADAETPPVTASAPLSIVITPGGRIQSRQQPARSTSRFDTVYFEGGEPFLFYAVMLAGLRMVCDAGLHAGVVTTDTGRPRWRMRRNGCGPWSIWASPTSV